MATLKEIATKLNVSITTVSRVLNNDTSLSVGPDVRKKIIKTATTMGYKTPRNRVRLKSNFKLNIAIIHWNAIDDDTNSHYLLAKRSIDQLSIKSNVNTLHLYKEDGEYNIDILESIDGLICIGKFSRNHILSFEKVSKNIVFIDSSPNESKFDSVMFDLNASVREILSTLIDRGYKKIGYIGGVEEISLTVKLGRKRELIFRDYLFQKNMLESKYIHIGSMTSESGYKLMKKNLEKSEKAEVYVCSNDSIALGALRAINEAGLNVPKDIGIIGFNNDDMSEYTFPPLTSVDVNGQFIGEQALISLLERIEGRNIPIKKIIPTKIIFRQSIK